MEKNQQKILYKRILNHLIKEYTLKEIIKFHYCNLYDICKLYGVVYVSQLWTITEEVEKEHGIIMNRVRNDIYNIE